MASKYWIKLYHEIIDDPKMGRLPDRTWRRTIEFFLLAGDRDDGGTLPAPTDIAWRLRIPEAELMEDLRALEAIGIMHQEDGIWIVTKFADRQAPVPASERGSRYRERQRKQEYYDEQTDDERDANESFADTDTDAEPDTDKESHAGADAAASGTEVGPQSFEDWHQFVTDAKNQPAAAKTMIDSLFKGQDVPFGRVGKTAQRVGGYGRLIDLLWQAAPRRPTGNVLDYVEAMAKGKGSRASPPSIYPGGQEITERFEIIPIPPEEVAENERRRREECERTGIPVAPPRNNSHLDRDGRPRRAYPVRRYLGT